APEHRAVMRRRSVEPRRREPSPSRTVYHRRSAGAATLGGAEVREGDAGVRGGASDFDDPAAPRRDHVEVDARDAVFGISEIERELAVDVADAHGGHLIAEHRTRAPSGEGEAVDRA